MKRLVLCGVAFVCLTAPWPRAAHSQTTRDYRDRTARLLDAYREARRVAEIAYREYGDTTALDTIRVGNLILLTHAEHTSAATRGAGLAWNELATTFGADTTLFAQLGFYAPSFARAFARPELEGRDVKFLRVPSGRPVGFRDGILAWAETWLDDTVDSLFGHWLRAAVPVTRPSTQPAWMYVEFATAHSPLAGECLDGNMEACRRALGLVASDDPLHDWYDADARRGLVTDLPGLRARDPEAAEVCIDRGWDQICDAMLAPLVENDRLPPPVDHRARLDLVQFALRHGGSGAHVRLFSAVRAPRDSIDIEDVLGAAAGIVFDTLLNDWRRSFVDAQPAQVTLQLRGAVVTMLWTVVLLAWAARNTRWR